MSAFYSWPARSRSLLPDLRQAFQAYILWTKGEGQPALPLFIGFLIVGFYLIRPFQTTATLGYDNVGSVGIRQPVCRPEFAVYD